MANEEILSLKIKDDGTIYDEHGHTVTKENGTTQVLNIDGRKCMYFNGGNYLKVLTDERFNLTGDFTIEFEPHATSLEAKGDGYVVASLGEDSGYVPYTAFSAKKSFIEAHPDVIQSFTNALQKGMDYVNSHSPEETAEVISPQFEATPVETITTIVTRYYEQDTWKDNLIFEEDSFTLLRNILEEAGELPARVPYVDLVTTDFAKEAAR